MNIVCWSNYFLTIFKTIESTEKPYIKTNNDINTNNNVLITFPTMLYNNKWDTKVFF